ncbi:MAG: VRR-NUC domain-containing protein [Eubacteriales bacterium]|jgi:Holliday junction resolvase
MHESNIERRLKREVEKRGGKALKFISPGWSGAPDRIVITPAGRVVFVELKAPGGQLRPLQEKRAAELKALNLSVYRVNSRNAVDKFISEVFGE